MINNIQKLFRMFTNDPVYVDRSWKYQCQECGFTLEMALDERLEKHDKNHQPVPFAISCPHCKGMMFHIDWKNNKTFERRAVKKGESYFRYDTSKKEDACGIPIKYVNGVRVKPRKRGRR